MQDGWPSHQGHVKSPGKPGTVRVPGLARLAQAGPGLSRAGKACLCAPTHDTIAHPWREALKANREWVGMGDRNWLLKH